MATIAVHDDHIEITFTTLEKVAGLVGDQRIPLASVTEVGVEPRPVRATSGIRAPGFALPGRSKIGTWRGRGSRQLVCARAGQSAVRIDADGQRFDRYLIGTDDAEAVSKCVRVGSSDLDLG